LAEQRHRRDPRGALRQERRREHRHVVEGSRPIDLVWIPPWISQVEYLWSEGSLERVMARLTRFARMITFDRRGSGVSDPFSGAPTLEEQMDDVLAPMNAMGSECAAVAGTLEGGPMAYGRRDLPQARRGLARRVGGAVLVARRRRDA
jgi:hypothetical protein